MANTKIINEKEYVEIELFCGDDVESAMERLASAAENGINAYGKFNEHILTSDMTIDEAYFLVVGKTKVEYDKDEQAWFERCKREEEEYKAKIPELIEKWKAEGRKVLSEDKITRWDEILLIRLNDLYREADLKSCLEIIALLNNGEPFDVVKCALDAQGHSGLSYMLVRAITRELANRGNDFYNYLIETEAE